MKYHIWTSGCQMNVADSRRVASGLEALGYVNSPKAENADVIVLNTCVVRQSAEDKAVGRLNSLKPLKTKNPSLVINLMGCFVGYKENDSLQKRFPYVDVFSAPSDVGPLISHLTQSETQQMLDEETRRQFAIQDGDLVLPASEKGKLVSAFVPIVLGCSHACTYCIIPYRRGIERSRPAAEILAETRSLVEQGVKEITLLGQIVDRYGKDLDDGNKLADLLRMVHEIDGLERIRFLTSHPNWMHDELLDAVAELPKVCEHIEVPVQAGDDEVLKNMRREYTVKEYYDLVEKIRHKIPKVSIATDIIVGFPGETEEQFMKTYQLMKDLRLDVAHLARYSTRPGTVADRKMVDDISEEEKMRRFRMLEELQAGILTDLNKQYFGEMVEVLFEGKVRGRWKGRTRTNRLVFVETEEDLTGQLLDTFITWTGPWSMQGRLPIKHQN